MRIALPIIILLGMISTASAQHFHCVHENGHLHCNPAPSSGLFSTPTRLCLCRDIGPRGGCRAWVCRRVI
jgi:hypothetical protein